MNNSACVVANDVLVCVEARRKRKFESTICATTSNGWKILFDAEAMFDSGDTCFQNSDADPLFTG